MFCIEFDSEFYSALRGFSENRRFASSEAFASVCSSVRVKSILGVGPKVKEVEDLVGKHSCWVTRQS
jgi:hypothetical protein